MPKLTRPNVAALGKLIEDAGSRDLNPATVGALIEKAGTNTVHYVAALTEKAQHATAAFLTSTQDLTPLIALVEKSTNPREYESKTWLKLMVFLNELNKRLEAVQAERSSDPKTRLQLCYSLLEQLNELHEKSKLWECVRADIIKHLTDGARKYILRIQMMTLQSITRHSSESLIQDPLKHAARLSLEIFCSTGQNTLSDLQIQKKRLETLHQALITLSKQYCAQSPWNRASMRVAFCLIACLSTLYSLSDLYKSLDERLRNGTSFDRKKISKSLIDDADLTSLLMPHILNLETAVQAAALAAALPATAAQPPSSTTVRKDAPPPPSASAPRRGYGALFHVDEDSVSRSLSALKKRLNTLEEMLPAGIQSDGFQTQLSQFITDAEKLGTENNLRPEQGVCLDELLLAAKTLQESLQAAEHSQQTPPPA